MAPRIFRVLDCMTNGPLILKDLVVITAFGRLVPEEMDSCVFNAREIFLGLKMLETVGLIPTSGEGIKGYLASY